MLKEERTANIIECLKEKNSATIRELADLNKVSEDTVRRDLEYLEMHGVLDRVRGGAVWRRENLSQHVYELRLAINADAKSQLAPLVRNVLKDGETLILNSGSTTVEIAKYIAQWYKRLTVITNDINIIALLSKKENFRLILLGGFIDKEENATYGSNAEEEIKQYNADVGIFAVNSISIDRGVRDFRADQLETFKNMIKVSDKVVVAIDASKFEKNSCMEVCGLDEVHCIISDEGLSKEQITAYSSKGIEVITPGNDEPSEQKTQN